MASLTKVTMEKRRMRDRKAGRKRKGALARKSTLSYEELFAAMGEPGQAAPAAPASAKVPS